MKTKQIKGISLAFLSFNCLQGYGVLHLIKRYIFQIHIINKQVPQDRIIDQTTYNPISLNQIILDAMKKLLYNNLLPPVPLSVLVNCYDTDSFNSSSTAKRALRTF